MGSLAVRTVAIAALVNAPFWVLGLSMFINRAAINVEAVLAAGVVALDAWIGVPLLIFVWMIDAGVGQTLTYHFATPLEFLDAGRFATELRWSQYFDSTWALIIGVFLVCGVSVVRLARRRPQVFWATAAVAFGLSLLDTLNGSALFSQRESRLYALNLAGSPTLNLAMAVAFRSTSATSLDRLEPDQSIAGLVDIPAWASTHPEAGALLVVVESLGAPMDARLQQWLDARVAVPGYQVATAVFPFDGATTRGELRSLCGLAGHYARLTAEIGAACLPNQLAALGWQSAGFHGFAGNMFDRKTWWPNTGLTEMHFIDSPNLFSLPRCGGTFAGTCDGEVIRTALDYLAPGYRLAYVLTLNTHLPMTRVEVPAELQALCARTGVTGEVCGTVAALGHVLDQIATQVAAATTRPLVVISGDHAPPFRPKVHRDAFSQAVVPAYALRPQ